MGTKLKPGKFDCYEAAKPDEPMYTLLARSRIAPLMLHLHAAVWAGDKIAFTGAVELLEHLLEVYKKEGMNPAREGRVLETKLCAVSMGNWRARNPNV